MHERPFLRIAPLVPARTEVQTFALREANKRSLLCGRGGCAGRRCLGPASNWGSYHL
jgi:hypothetical protein